MENINKKELLENFISNNIAMNNLLKKQNRKVFDYIIKEDNSSKIGIELLRDIIKDFIEETFYFDEDIKTKEDLLELIENYDLVEYVDGLVDIYDEDLLNSYTYFQEFIEKEEQVSDILEIMKRAQFDGYLKFYEYIRNEFIEFLKKT